jgi:hypothetical protein
VQLLRQRVHDSRREALGMHRHLGAGLQKCKPKHPCASACRVVS